MPRKERFHQVQIRDGKRVHAYAYEKRGNWFIIIEQLDLDFTPIRTLDSKMGNKESVLDLAFLRLGERPIITD